MLANICKDLKVQLNVQNFKTEVEKTNRILLKNENFKKMLQCFAYYIILRCWFCL